MRQSKIQQCMCCVQSLPKRQNIVLCLLLTLIIQIKSIEFFFWSFNISE